MAKTDSKPSSTARGEKRRPLGCPTNPDRPAGRPPIPPNLDPRIEVAKTWPPRARQAAKAAFSAAMAAGRSRDEAIDAGHEAGLRIAREAVALPPEALSLIEKAKSLFDARVVGVVEPGTYPPIFDHCFEMHFPKPETPASDTRSPHAENQETSKPREALAGELAKAPQQASLDFEGRTRTA